MSDRGPGIAAEYLPKITEPFYRPDASRTRKTGGFGLGLHLAKLIAEAHGGVLAIESVALDDQRYDVGTSGATEASSMPYSGTVVTVAIPLSDH